MSIIDDMKNKKKKEFVNVSGKVESYMKKKIDYICKESGISSRDYLGKLLENSEIDSVYNKLIKDSNSANNSDASDTNNE